MDSDHPLLQGGGSLASDGGSALAGDAPPQEPSAARHELTCEELELFHDCGCPKVRECVCYIYTEGCGKCGECLKNLLYAKETGKKGGRICKLAQADVDEVTVAKYKIEYPRHLIRMPPHRARLMGHSVRQLRFVRKVLDFTLDQQAHELKLLETALARRMRLNMAMNDPHELLASRAFTSAYYDTDLVHGHKQRVRKDQVWALTAPLIAESLKGLARVKAVREALYAHWRPFAAFHITRVAKGFGGRLTARNKRRAMLRHFACLRIQAAWRGFHDRKYVIPNLRAWYELKCAQCIQRAWRRYRDVRTFKWRARAKLWRRKQRGATAMAALFRGYMTRTYLGRVRAEAAAEKAAFEARKGAVLAQARARREAIRTRAATTIQRLWRGIQGRRAVYARSGAGQVSNARVQELTDKFLASGDLWGFVAAINSDYNLAEREKRREITRAKAFVDQVIRVREEKGERAWRQWQEFKAGAGGGRGGGAAALAALGDRPPSRVSGVGSLGGGGGSRPGSRGGDSASAPPSRGGGGAGSPPPSRPGTRGRGEVLHLANETAAAFASASSGGGGGGWGDSADFPSRPVSRERGEARREEREAQLARAYSPLNLPGSSRPGSRSGSRQGGRRPSSRGEQAHAAAAAAAASAPGSSSRSHSNSRSSAYPPPGDEATFKLTAIKQLYLTPGGFATTGQLQQQQQQQGGGGLA